MARGSLFARSQRSGSGRPYTLAIDIGGTGLKALVLDRAGAAVKERVRVETVVDAESRIIRSGASGRLVQLPADVRVDALLTTRCYDRLAGATIDFFPSGMSCGGVIALTRSGLGYEVRVNWLTGGVDVVPHQPL